MLAIIFRQPLTANVLTKGPLTLGVTTASWAAGENCWNGCIGWRYDFQPMDLWGRHGSQPCAHFFRVLVSESWWWWHGQMGNEWSSTAEPHHWRFTAKKSCLSGAVVNGFAIWIPGNSLSGSLAEGFQETFLGVCCKTGDGPDFWGNASHPVVDTNHWPRRSNETSWCVPNTQLAQAECQKDGVYTTRVGGTGDNDRGTG